MYIRVPHSHEEAHGLAAASAIPAVPVLRTIPYMGRYTYFVPSVRLSSTLGLSFPELVMIHLQLYNLLL